jgi:DNA-binding XRE family transcriptional regulator
MNFYEYTYILLLRGADFSPSKCDFSDKIAFNRVFEKGELMRDTTEFKHRKGGVEIHSEKTESLRDFLKRIAVLTKADLERNKIDYVGFELIVTHTVTCPTIPIDRKSLNLIRKISFLAEVVVKFRWKNTRLSFLPYEGDNQYYFKKQRQLGAAMRSARESRNISTQSVAEKFGISEASLKKIEDGKLKSEYWFVKELEEFYKLKIDDFLGEIEELPEEWEKKT